MLNNAGKKIILWSQILLIAGIALSIIAGVFIIVRGALYDPYRVTINNTTYLYRAGMLYGGRYIAAGFLVMIFGSLGSWLLALLLRTFGDLSIDTRAIRERLEETPAAEAVKVPVSAPFETPEKPAEPETAKPEKPDGE